MSVAQKYPARPTVHFPQRTWVNRTLQQAPIWCSSDLRDGNQALVTPMDREKKLAFFDLLVKIGFKQIEVAFPAASQTDFDFVRQLITENRIPADVTIQVMTQAREDLIRRTFASLVGAPRAIVHLYNATSPYFREHVLGKDRAQLQAFVREQAQIVQDCAANAPETQWTLQYSPETFNATELPFALEICQTVLSVWQPSATQNVILNLPATVECNTPNVYADQIEWMAQQLPKNPYLTLSIHPHNDRGTAVAAAELAMLAGAQRVEGCLFGNGERTGNVDLMNLALNLQTQGIDPQLDFSNMDQIVHQVSQYNQLPIHPRHPYAGELVFTAFSGSHQDAIKKGFAAQTPETAWQVPYLPIDPADLNRTYDAVIRVNSQSGKGGMSYLLEQEYGLQLPRAWQQDFSRRVQHVLDNSEQELNSQALWQLFEQAYATPAAAWKYTAHQWDSKNHQLQLQLSTGHHQRHYQGKGEGTLAAALAALLPDATITAYHQHALTHGQTQQAAAYVVIEQAARTAWGFGMAEDIAAASLSGLVAAVQRLQHLD